MGWWVMIMMGDFFCPVNSEVKVLATEIFGGWDFGVGVGCWICMDIWFVEWGERHLLECSQPGIYIFLC